MAKKHMKKCSRSMVIEEIQMKTTLRFHLTPASMTIIKTQTTTNVEEDMGERTPYTLLVGM
jgi:hypothetical protein